MTYSQSTGQLCDAEGNLLATGSKWGRQSCLRARFPARPSRLKAGLAGPGGPAPAWRAAPQNAKVQSRLKADCSQDWLPHKDGTVISSTSNRGRQPCFSDSQLL